MAKSRRSTQLKAALPTLPDVPPAPGKDLGEPGADGDPIILRDTGTEEVYSLDWHEQ